MDGCKETALNALTKIDHITQATVANLRPHEPSFTEMPTIPSNSLSSFIRLPKLQLRPFSGDLTKWTSFWESFKCAVHNNRDLPDIEKFNYMYLTSVLEHSARDTISGLALTATNYHKAVDILTKRFVCKKQIMNMHMDVLLKV